MKTVSWLKDGKTMPGHEESVLRIDSVRKEDKGMYQCVVRNEQESAQGSAELKLGGRCKLIILLPRYILWKLGTLNTSSRRHLQEQKNQ